MANSVAYGIEPHLSTFRVQVKAGGMLSAFGHNPTIAIRDFSGEAHFAPDAPQSADLKVAIRADSLQVADKIKDSDRRDIERTMRDDVLEIEKYPQIEFASESVASAGAGNGPQRLTVNGHLTLHGVTRPLSIPAQVSLMGDMLNASGEFTVRQSDFGIKPVSAVGGGLKVKDELNVTFHFVGRRQ